MHGVAAFVQSARTMSLELQESDDGFDGVSWGSLAWDSDEVRAKNPRTNPRGLTFVSYAG